MIFKLQYWPKSELELPTTELVFKNMGLLMAYFKPHFPIELTENHWTVLADMDEYQGNQIVVNNGAFLVGHSQMTRQEINDLMAVNPAYQRMEIQAIRQAFLNEYDK